MQGSRPPADRRGVGAKTIGRCQHGKSVCSAAERKGRPFSPRTGQVWRKTWIAAPGGRTTDGTLPCLNHADAPPRAPWDGTVGARIAGWWRQFVAKTGERQLLAVVPARPAVLLVANFPGHTSAKHVGQPASRLNPDRRSTATKFQGRGGQSVSGKAGLRHFADAAARHATGNFHPQDRAACAGRRISSRRSRPETACFVQGMSSAADLDTKATVAANGNQQTDGDSFCCKIRAEGKTGQLGVDGCGQGIIKPLRMILTPLSINRKVYAQLHSALQAAEGIKMIAIPAPHHRGHAHTPTVSPDDFINKPGCRETARAQGVVQRQWIGRGVRGTSAPFMAVS